MAGGDRAGYGAAEAAEAGRSIRMGSPVSPRHGLSTTSAVVLLVMVQLIFAYNALLGRMYMTAGTNPLVFSFFRDISAAIILMALAWFGGSWRTPRGRDDILGVAAIGFLGVFFCQVLFLVALKYVMPSTVTLFQLLIAVCTPFVAAAVGYERLWQGPTKTCYRFLGLAICVTGAGATLVAHGAKAGGGLTGSAVLMIQVLAAATYTVLMKSKLTAGWTPLPLVAWTYAIGSLGLLPVLPLVPAGDWALSYEACGVLVFSVLMASVFNYIAMATVNAKLGATMVTAFFPLQPIFAALGQPFFGMQAARLADSLGGLVVGCGLALFLWAESMGASSDEFDSPKDTAHD